MTKLIYFSAPWCGPCKVLSPIVESLDDSRLTVVKVNVDNDLDMLSKFDVRSVPTLILEKDDVVLDRYIGSMNALQLNEWISEVCSND